MNNHLSHRWPTTTPAPAPVPAVPCSVPVAAPPKKKRRGLRIFLLVLACVVGAILLIGASFFGIGWLMEHSEGQLGTYDPLPSFALPSALPGQTATGADALPWGSPDPDTTISLAETEPAALTPQEIYRQVLPSVVCVQVDYGDGSGYGVGSGVVLTESGYIITNYHVVEDGTTLDVMLLSTEEVYEARLIGYDEELDIAVLKIDAPDLVPAALGDSDALVVGDSVYAIGNPMGYLYGTMSDGIVSALARQVDIDDSSMTLIQTSVPLNSGNSGGALVDIYGRVVGITVAKMSGVEDNVVIEGIGLAIPITDALPFVNHIIHTGTSYRPALGIMCYELLRDGQKGILVDTTTPGTPAAEVLQAGDFIIAANGEAISGLYDLTRALNATGVGNEIELTILRGGQELTVSIVLYDRLETE